MQIKKGQKFKIVKYNFELFAPLSLQTSLVGHFREEFNPDKLDFFYGNIIFT